MLHRLSTSSSTFSHTPSVRHYHSTLSIWLSVDPMSDKYPSMSPYTYCANNPVRLVDPDGREIYFLFYTDNESCFKASAETRKYNIEHSNQVRGQQTAAYPSTNPCWRDINLYHAKLGWFSSRNTYMVGGRNGKGLAAVFGGDYAIPLSCFKNGRRQLPTYQQSK